VGNLRGGTYSENERRIVSHIANPNPDRYPDIAAQPSQMEVEDKAMRDTPRPTTPDINPPPIQPIHATPVRYRGSSSAALGTSKSLTVEDIV
jgi:hypothetical protein